MATTYPAVYRARAVKYEPPVVTAYVPQVFGQTAIEIIDSIGTPSPGMGWVFFQGGNPEFPVWTSGLAGAGGGGGTVTDTLWVGPGAPPDPSIEMWWDTDEPPQGGGTEEVYIGAEPPGEGYELWYDTNADAPLTIDQRWNTAWGTIAVGTLNTMAGFAFTSTTLANLSSPMTVTLLAGRRYEFEARIHATVAQAVGNGLNLQFTGLGVGNDTWSYSSNLGWSHASHLVPAVGTGAAVTVTLQGMLLNAGTTNLWTGPASYFVCRDVGPTTLVPAPPPPDWSMYDARYPFGVVGYAQVTANQAGITTVADLTGLSVTFTAAAERSYKLVFGTYLFSTAVNDVVRTYLTDSANNVKQQTSVTENTGTSGGTAVGVLMVSGISGSVTYKLRGLRHGGTGSVTSVADTSRPAFLLVEDIGIL